MPKRITPQLELEIAQRRRKVAELYLRRMTQMEIGQLLDVDQKTVSRDLVALKAQWRKDASAEVDARIAREAAELDEMERDAAIKFNASGDVAFLNTRLKIKERKAKLFGYDQPTKLSITEIDAIIDAAVPELNESDDDLASTTIQ